VFADIRFAIAAFFSAETTTYLKIKKKFPSQIAFQNVFVKKKNDNIIIKIKLCDRYLPINSLNKYNAILYQRQVEKDLKTR